MGYISRKPELDIQKIPPYKQTPADKREKQLQMMRSNVLRDEARQKFKSLIQGNICLTIKYKRCRGSADAVNIISGIADALIAIAYRDDNQIREVHYSETKGNIDEYWIQVEKSHARAR